MAQSGMSRILFVTEVSNSSSHNLKTNPFVSTSGLMTRMLRTVIIVLASGCILGRGIAAGTDGDLRSTASLRVPSRLKTDWDELRNLATDPADADH